GLDLTVGTLFDRAVVQGGTRIAVTHGSRSYTYAELGRSASRLTAALQALHVGKGDRVAFLMPNSPEYITCEYAVAKAGATRVPLASVLAVDDYVSMLNRACCKVLIYDANLADRVRRMMQNLKAVEHFIYVGDNARGVPDGHLSLQSLLDSTLSAAR